MTHAPSERTSPPAPAPVTNLMPGARPETRRNWRRILLSAGPAALIVTGGLYYLLSGRYVSTDDAYVKSRIVTVTSNVAGQVVEVPVTDNQLVKAGTVLVKIDPEPYRLKLALAQADLDRTVQEIEALRATVRSRMQDLAQAKNDLDYYQREYDRQKGLIGSGAVARSGADKAERDMLTARDRVGSLDQQIHSSLAQLSGSLDTPTEKLPNYLAALATRDSAAYNLDKATIVAARDGRVGTVTVRVGEYVAPGQALFPEIIVGDTWIEANLRETDTTYLHEGQEASFSIDAYPDHEFHAKVQSFSPATGSELSVLPAENATGNWVKIVQRLPVKLVPELRPGDPPLRAGLSVNVDIDTGTYHNMPRFLRALFGMNAASEK